MLGPDRTQEFGGILERLHRVYSVHYIAFPAGPRAASHSQTFDISIVNI